MRASRTMLLFGVLSTTSLILACDRGADVLGDSPPALRLIDSVLLIESDSVFVGEASGLAVPADGSFLIADKRNGTLHVFGADGRRRGSLGRRGAGPEEWSNGPSLLSHDDSVVAAGDAARLKVLRYPPGTWDWERPKAALTIPVAVGNGRIFISHVDFARRKSIDAVRGPLDSIVSGGPFTTLMGENPLISQLFSFLDVAILGGDTIAVAIEHSDDLFIGPFPNGPYRSLPVRRVARRGALVDQLRLIDPRTPATIERVIYQPSYPLELVTLGPRGRLALVSADRVMVSGRMTGSLFVSLVSLRNGTSCVDAQVPVPTDPFPFVAFRAETLLVLTQDEAADGKPRTIIRKFHVDDDRCTWR